MELEENVCEQENTKTGQEVVKEKGVQSRECGALEGSAVLGKFKSVDALAKAYAQLQAEFTRRSQRLKELQKERENLEKGEREVIDGTAAFGAEKLRKTAAARAEEERKFDRFVAQIETELETRPEQKDAEAAEENEKEVALNAVEREQNAEGSEVEKREDEQNAAMETLREDSAQSVAKSRENDENTTEELYARATENEEVRLRIIGEYLHSIGKGAPLMKGGVGVTLAPKMKATTLEQAGNMALRFFKGEA